MLTTRFSHSRGSVFVSAVILMKYLLFFQRKSSSYVVHVLQAHAFIHCSSFETPTDVHRASGDLSSSLHSAVLGPRFRSPPVRVGFGYCWGDMSTTESPVHQITSSAIAHLNPHFPTTKSSYLAQTTSRSASSPSAPRRCRPRPRRRPCKSSLPPRRAPSCNGCRMPVK